MEQSTGPFWHGFSQSDSDAARMHNLKNRLEPGQLCKKNTFKYVRMKNENCNGYFVKINYVHGNNLPLNYMKMHDNNRNNCSKAALLAVKCYCTAETHYSVYNKVL